MIHLEVEVKANINKRNILNLKSKKSNPPFPSNVICVGNDQLGYKVKYDLSMQQNKHFKSNSDAVTNIFMKEHKNEIGDEASENMYNKLSNYNKISPKNNL